MSFSSFHVSLFNLVSLFHFKYYKTLKKKPFITRIKHDLIIDKGMSEKLRQNPLTKYLD